MNNNTTDMPVAKLNINQLVITPRTYRTRLVFRSDKTINLMPFYKVIEHFCHTGHIEYISPWMIGQCGKC